MCIFPIFTNIIHNIDLPIYRVHGQLIQSSQQMAIFVVKGKLQTSEDDIIDFSPQHTFDFSQSQGYILRASVSGGLQKLQECLGIRPDSLTGSGEQKHFESAVMALTKIYGDSGLYEMIEALFAL